MNRREVPGAMAVVPRTMRGVDAIASRAFEIITKIGLEESHDDATGGEGRDSLDPEDFNYMITAREV
jgi:hypothetical protein